MSSIRHFLKRLQGKIFPPKKNSTEQDILTGFAALGPGFELGGRISFHHKDRICIGSHVYIGPGTQLFGQGGIDIHDHVIFGPEIVILTAIHNYDETATMLPYDEVDLLRKVTIEKCVWVGMRAIILPGVQIGEGSVIGSGAVVSKSCPPGSILAGNPAQIVKTRNMEHYYKLVEEERFYLMLKQNHKFSKRELHQSK